MKKQVKCSKCCYCGQWRPVRELKLHLVAHPLMSRQESWRNYECPTHTEKQKRRFWANTRKLFQELGLV